MATVKAIKYGMKGDDVTNLQTTLKNAGYDVDVDGSFGPQTLAAVKQYQQANGLDVDGMVGPQTSAVLFGSSSGNSAASTPASTTPTTGQASNNASNNASNKAAGVTAGAAAGSAASEATKINYPDDFSYDDFSYDEFSYGDYQQSETVTQAQAALDAALAAQPGAYQSKWQGQIDEMIGRILNREKFTYDVNEDALYQQYAEQYQRLGKLAMQDTMGQAAAMTGGYGSSYAQSVGQQAYQGYLQQLNEMVPELYGMALDQYNREGQEMYNQYGLLSDQEAQDYGRYQDSYNQWLAERDYAASRYDSERDYDYSKYVDDRNYEYGKYADDRNFDYGVYADDRNQAYSEYLDAVQREQFDAQYEESIRQYNENMAFNQEQADIANSQWEQSFAYQQDRDKVSDSQWQQSFDESQRQYNASLAEDQRQFDTSFNESKRQYEEAKASAASGSGGSGSSGTKDAALEHVASMSSAEVVETMQGYSADGDNTGLAAFLDDCVASGRLTEAQADEYYEKYRKDGHTITDTTVPKKSGSGSGGGAGGQISYKQ